MSVDAAERETPSAPDRDEIVRAVSLYINGWGAHRPEMFTEAMHPDSRMYFTFADGTPWTGPLLGSAVDPNDSWADRRGPAVGRILTVIQAGDVAAVLLGIDTPSDQVGDGSEPRWVDIHTLLRIDGNWKIMAKTATHASRADWAGKA